METSDDNLKKNPAGENAAPDDKIDLDKLSSSMKEFEETIEVNEKELSELAKKRKEILDKIQDKIQQIKSETEIAKSKFNEEKFSEALISWEKVLALDPKSDEAQNAVVHCKLKIEELKSKEALIQSESSLGTEKGISRDLESVLNSVAKDVNKTVEDEFLLSQEELDKMMVGFNKKTQKIRKKVLNVSFDAPCDEFMLTQDDVNRILSRDNIERVMIKNNLADEIVNEVKQTNKIKEEAVSQAELDAMLAGMAGGAKEEVKQPEAAVVPEKEEMNQAELDAMLAGMSGGAKAEAKQPEAAGVSEKEEMNQAELDAMLAGMSGGANAEEKTVVSERVKSSAFGGGDTELLEKSEIDAMLAKADDKTKEEPVKVVEEGVSLYTTNIDSKALIGDLELNDEAIKATSESFAKLSKYREYANLVESDSAYIIVKPELLPEEALAEDVGLDSEAELKAVMEMPVEPDTADLLEMEKLGDTVAAQYSQVKFDETHLESTQEDTSDKTAILASVKTPESTVITRKKKITIYIGVISMFILGFVGVFGIIKSSHRTEVTQVAFYPMIENKLKQGATFIQTGMIENGLNTLLSIREDYPSTEFMIDTLYKAANIYHDFIVSNKTITNDDYMKEAMLFEQIIENFPRDQRSLLAYFRAADSYFKIGAYNKATNYYESIIKNFPDSEYFEEALFMNGKILLNQDKFKEAREYFLKIIDTFPETSSSRLAQIYIAQTYQQEADKIKREFKINGKA